LAVWPQLVPRKWFLHSPPLTLKTVGDYVGHRTPDATKIYTKVNIERLREVALGEGEEVL
jgi:hypothetical protein